MTPIGALARRVGVAARMARRRAAGDPWIAGLIAIPAAMSVASITCWSMHVDPWMFSIQRALPAGISPSMRIASMAVDDQMAIQSWAYGFLHRDPAHLQANVVTQLIAIAAIIAIGLRAKTWVLAAVASIPVVGIITILTTPINVCHLGGSGICYMLITGTAMAGTVPAIGAIGRAMARGRTASAVGILVAIISLLAFASLFMADVVWLVGIMPEWLADVIRPWSAGQLTDQGQSLHVHGWGTAFGLAVGLMVAGDDVRRGGWREAVAAWRSIPTTRP